MNDQQLIREKISCALKEYRTLNKLSQGQIAIKIGVKQRAEASYEEKRATPSIAVLKKISLLLNVSLDNLINTD